MYFKSNFVFESLGILEICEQKEYFEAKYISENKVLYFKIDYPKSIYSKINF